MLIDLARLFEAGGLPRLAKLSLMDRERFDSAVVKSVIIRGIALGERIKLENIYLDGMPGKRVGACVRAALVTPQTCPFLLRI